MARRMRRVGAAAVFAVAAGVAVAGAAAAPASAASTTQQHTAAVVVPDTTACFQQGGLDFAGTRVSIRQAPNTSSGVNGYGNPGDCFFPVPFGQVTGQNECNGSYCTDQWQLGFDSHDVSGYVTWAFLEVS